MTYLIDGVSLDDPAGRWLLDAATLLPAAASRDVAKLRLNRRDGVVTRRLSWGEGSAQLRLNVLSGPAPLQPVHARLRTLQSLLARAATLRLVDDIDRSVAVTEADVSSPTRLGTDDWAIEATLTLQPFWRAGSLLTAPSVDVPAAGPVVFEQWAGTTGDLVDGILRLRGPFTRREVRALDSSGVIAVGTVTDAQYVFVDVANFRAWRGGSTAWTPTATAVALDYPAAGPLRLYPSAGGVELALAGDGFGATTSIALRAHRYYL